MVVVAGVVEVDLVVVVVVVVVVEVDDDAVITNILQTHGHRIIYIETILPLNASKSIKEFPRSFSS